MKPEHQLVRRPDVEVELEQLCDEGRDTRRVEPEFKRLLKSDLARPAAQAAALELFASAEKLPALKGYPFLEPSDLAGIRKQRPRPARLPRLRLSDAALLDRLHGAWLGRCAGCLLGKPLEGIRSHQLWPYLEATGQYPLRFYVSPKAPDRVFKKCDINESRRKRLDIPFTAGCMPEDDDTNYTVTGLALLKKHGADFEPKDVGRFWLENIPYHHVCTAEKVAYRNMVMGIEPLRSATYVNPYREWIGAQIRADALGYVNPGRPEKAADMAYRDAALSHVKNGIYGEMWAAACLATAFVESDPRAVLETGLAEIPRRCRLAEALRATIAWAEQSYDWEHTWARVNNAYGRYHVVHTINNACAVALALLHGSLDFERTISIAVMCGWDTDCNGATAGSFLGAMLGAAALPDKWIVPLHDSMHSSVEGFSVSRISDLAERTLAQAAIVLAEDAD